MENLVAKTKLYYKDKTVLITGHTGFKGSWLALLVNQLGGRVHGISLKNDDPNAIYNMCNVGNKIASEYYLDIRDFDGLQTAIDQIAPDVVFHLAAQPIVKRSYKNPLETFSTNIMGTANVLECLTSQPNLMSIVNVTTDKVYKNKEWVWGYRETDELGGTDPYAASKACSELISRTYEEKFLKRKIGLVTARAGNVIGGGDWSEDRLVPDLMRSIYLGAPLIIRNPMSVRPWQHVLDAIMPYLTLGYACALNPNKYGGSWNFAPEKNDEVTVIEMINYFKSHINGICYEIDHKNTNVSEETKILKLNSDKAKSQLGWRPKLTTTQSIQFTAQWYQTASLEKHDVSIITNNQIKQYLEIF